jgi:hypothetical protein
MLNKKGIGFGRFFVILVFVLLGITLWLLIVASSKIEASIGTEELNTIDNTNLKFYFYDSMRIGFSKALNELAKDSFIDKNDLGCKLNPKNEIILNENCKPEASFLNKKIIEKVTNYVNDSLTRYLGYDPEVYCKIEQGLLKCETKELKLNDSRKTSFFNYDIEYKFKLNSSLNVDNQVNDIIDIYEQGKSCIETCTIASDIWQLDSFKESENFFVFSLETKKPYAQDSSIEPIVWEFSIKKST